MDSPNPPIVAPGQPDLPPIAVTPHGARFLASGAAF